MILIFRCQFLLLVLFYTLLVWVYGMYHRQIIFCRSVYQSAQSVLRSNHTKIIKSELIIVILTGNKMPLEYLEKSPVQKYDKRCSKMYLLLLLS